MTECKRPPKQASVLAIALAMLPRATIHQAAGFTLAMTKIAFGGKSAAHAVHKTSASR
jgi:hypothetical protein